MRITLRHIEGTKRVPRKRDAPDREARRAYPSADEPGCYDLAALDLRDSDME